MMMIIKSAFNFVIKLFVQVTVFQYLSAVMVERPLNAFRPYNHYYYD